MAREDGDDPSCSQAPYGNFTIVSSYGDALAARVEGNGINGNSRGILFRKSEGGFNHACGRVPQLRYAVILSHS